MPYSVDLGKYGKEHNVQVQYTDFFSQSDPMIPGIGGRADLRQALFSLGVDEASDVAEVEGKFYIFQVAERKPSYLPEMEAVSDKLREDVVSDLAAKKAKAEGEAYLEELRKGTDWESLAAARKLKPVETEAFGRHDSIAEIGYAPELSQAAFMLNEETPFPKEVFEQNGVVYVVRWEGNVGIDEEKFLEEKERYRFGLMESKRESLFQSWLVNLRKNADIRIHSPVVRG
jgi:peptidyl-prolyl cis-trans isomerase D